MRAQTFWSRTDYLPFNKSLAETCPQKKKASDYQSATTAGKIYNTLNAEEQGTATKLNFLNNHTPQGNLI